MKILKLAEFGGKLKRLPRTGWVMSKVKDPESVAEHSFRVALLAMALAPQVGADQLKAMKMGLIHDLAEAEIGDIVIERGNKILADSREKLDKEHSAMKMISEQIGANELLELFIEYNDKKTLESQLVKQLDRLEMAIQAHEYEVEQSLNLEEFFLSVRKEVVHDDLKMILHEIDELRHKNEK